LAIDRNKVLEAAQQQLDMGNYDKAIAEYQTLVQDDPRDVKAWLKIGDLQTRMGNIPAAVETYSKVGEVYAKQGVHLKAVAVYKQIVKLDPERMEVYEKLGATYVALGLMNEALAAYDQVASVYLRDGRVEEALGPLTRATELDPEDVQARIKLAEALSRAGKRDEAAREFEKSGSVLKSQGRMDDYVKVAERLLFHRQDDVALARDLAGEYLERGDAKRALSRLQLCFKTDPRDVVTLDLLARAFHALGQTAKAISVYR
jgi:pilus assembly protein FimV